MALVRVILLGVLLAVAARIYSEYRRAILRDFVVHEHHPGKCQVVSGIRNGSEDVALVPGTSYALITNGLRLTREPNKPGGHIYIFDFKNPAGGARPLKFVNFDKQAPYFMPHGLKIWPSWPAKPTTTASAADAPSQHTTSATYFVYVVSHVQNGKVDHVEKFRFDTANPTQLTFVRSFTSEHFHGVVNAVAVVGEDKFYFTNFLPYFYKPIIGSLPQLEVLLGAPTGSVGYYDGTTDSGQIVARGHLAPNGIAVSHDLSTVYVAESHSGYLFTYARGLGKHQPPPQSAAHSGELNSLSLVAKNYTAYGILDNIVVDDNGDLLIGTSPFGHGMWNFVFGMFANRRLESAVLKLHIDPKTNIPVSTRELFMDDAKLMNGGSVAVTYNNGRQMLVGSVTDTLVHCECSVGC